MKCERYVIDTNVLIAASAADPSSSVAQDATPDDPTQRMIINEWLHEFANADTRLVLDGRGKILDEYSNKLKYSEFARQVVIEKMSKNAVDYVDIEYDEYGHAILEDSLAQFIHDLSDRKMVAAVLDAQTSCPPCFLANASDTDWYDWEEVLKENGIEVEQIIHDWAHAKWLEKKARG